MSSNLAQVRNLELNPPAITTGGQSSLANPYGVGYTSPLVSRPTASYENVASDAWTWPSNMLIDPVSISTTIEQTVMTSNSFLIQTILPLITTDQVDVKFSKFIFKPYLPSKMPYFSVARFVKSETESREAAFVRVGLGFTLEQNFMNSPLGQIHYLEHMKQISQAFIEQLNFDAIVALLDTDMWANDKQSRIRDINGKVYVEQVEAIMEREVILWNYMQKTDNAWDQLDKWVDTQVARYTQERLTTWVVDQRIDGFRSSVPRDQTDYYIHGPGNRSGLEDGVQFFSRDARGNTIYCTRGYKIDERPEFNPLETLQQTGEFYMNVDLPTYNFNKYDTSLRSMLIYNEDLDRMDILTLNDMIDNCWRFNDQGDVYAPNQLLRNHDASFGDLLGDFLYRRHRDTGAIVPKSLFGQLDMQHFNVKDKLNLGESVNAALKMNMTSDEIGKMLNDMKRCVQAIADIRPTGDQVNAWVSFVSANGTFAITGDNVSTITAFGWPLPVTHATYTGFKEIERQANSPQGAALNAAFSSYYVDLIRKNMPIFDTWVQKLDNMFPGCTLLSPDHVTTNSINPTVFDAAFENFLTRDTYFVPYPFPAASDRVGIVDERTVRTLDPLITTSNAILNNSLPDGGDIVDQFNIRGANGDVLYFAALLIHSAVVVSDVAGNLENTVRSIQTHLPEDGNYTIENLAALCDILQSTSQLRQLVNDVRRVIFSTEKTFPFNPLALQSAGLRVTTEDIAANATYADRYNGASANVNTLPMVRKIRNTPAPATPAVVPRASAPSSVGGSARTKIKHTRNVGFTGGRQRTANASSVSSSPSNVYTPPPPVANATIPDIDDALDSALPSHYREAHVRFANEPQYLFPILAFLFTRITKLAVTASANYGYWHYCNYIVARAHMLYSTVGGFKTIPGSDTGNTFIAKMMANVANDNQTDEMFVHIAGYHGALVTNTKRVFHTPNILVTKYHQGNGMGFINPQDYSPAQGVFGASKDASLIVLAVPRNERFGKCFSLSGELSMTTTQGVTVPIRGPGDEKSHTYSSAPFYNRMYGFNSWNWNAPVRGLSTREKFVPNRIVYSSATLYQNQLTKEYTIATSNTGHWDTRLVGTAKGAQRVGRAALDGHGILSYVTPASLTCIY